MKKNIWFFAIAILTFILTGCVSTPRLTGPPVVSVPFIPMTVPLFITAPTYYHTTVPAYNSFYYGSGTVFGGGSFWSGLASGHVGRTPRWQSTPGYRHFWGGWQR